MRLKGIQITGLIIVFIAKFVLYTNLGYSHPSDNTWTFLSTTTIRAHQFIKEHPQYDGRQAVIIICDSGVDMGVPGLQKTSTGETKVIDVQDFSGEGDVFLSYGEIKQDENEHYILHPDGFKLFDYDKLDKEPLDNNYLIGYIDETDLINSRVKDLNNNGKRDDLFGILTFEVNEDNEYYWIVYVDTDGDRHIDDEKAIRNYRDNYDCFQLRGREKSWYRDLMTFALNIDPDAMKASLHFDDSGHGTHVAGIAAGYNINGQQGLNGIAPGARIISLKIGNGTLKGGSTISKSMKKALNYGVNYAEANEIPVIFNFSYGIGSVKEGRSEIDLLIDDILYEHENIFIVLSNGNEGPGISSSGTPAAASRAFSVGALLPRTIARDCYGADLPEDKIFHFSARGGELPKPDALAPGAAASAVPFFRSGDIMGGTSMAAPQVSGAAALLISAIMQTNSFHECKGILLKKALKYSATLLPDYTYLDQGTGVINVPRAYNLLKTYLKRNEKCIMPAYDIETESPIFDDDVGPSAYWRSAGYFPHQHESQKFSIYPIFSDSLDADARAKFYRAFELKPSHKWVKPDKKFAYIKGENPLEINVNYNSSLLKVPGLYVAKITAFRKNSNQQYVEFELFNTIIIPHLFDYQNNYRHDFDQQKLAPGDIKRYFIQVPPGATTAKILVSAIKHKFCTVRCYLFNPAGHKYKTSSLVESKKQDEEILIIPQQDLGPGIWEVVVYADFKNKKDSYFDLSISFYGFNIQPSVISDFDYNPGQDPMGYFEVTNNFNNIFNGFAHGKILGYQRQLRKRITTSDIFSYDFNAERDIEKIIFDITFPEDIFLKFTDVAINILDEDGKAIIRDAMSYNNKLLVLHRPDSESYTLEIHVAFTNGPISEAWQFNLTEKYFTTEKINIAVYKNDKRLFKLYPNKTEKLEFTLNRSPRIAPDDYSIFGSIDFTDRHLLHKTFSIPVEFPAR